LIAISKCEVDHGDIHQFKAFLEFEAFNKKGDSLGTADATLLTTDKKFIWLHELQIEPECRNKGVGSILIDAIASFGKDEKAQLIYAFPMTPIDEKKPIPQEKIDHFYKKNGFTSCMAPQDVATITDDGLKKKGVCLKL
jgi:GNAT superfamily N-acetyltransferase